MEPTSSPDNARQSRGLARFWPTQGMPAPAQRQSDDDAPAPDALGGEPAAREEPAAPVPVSHSGSAQAVAAHLARTEGAPAGEPQMVALGSRRGFDPAPNGSARWGLDQGGFPPGDAERDGDAAPRHGGDPARNGLPPVAARPPAGGSTFGTPVAPADQIPRPSFAGPPADQTPRPLYAAAPADEVPRPPLAGPPADPTPRPSLAGATPPDTSGPRPPASGSPVPFPAGTSAPGSPAPFTSATSQTPDTGAAPAFGAVPPFATPAPAGDEFRGVAAQNDGDAPGSGRRRSLEADADSDTGPDGDAPAGRADTSAASRPTGWASVPTSGSPQVNGHGGTAPAGPVAVGAVNGTGRAPFGPAFTGAAAGGSEPDADGAGARSAANRANAAEAASAAAVAAEPETRPYDSTRSHPVAPAHRPQDADAAMPGGEPARPRAAAAVAPMRPGDVDLVPIAFWDEEAIAHFRSQWHEVKADFVDDPVAALTRAHDLLTDAVNELTEALLAERDELDPLRTTTTPDTESMRMAMRGYREFLDRILAL